MPATGCEMCRSSSGGHPSEDRRRGPQAVAETVPCQQLNRLRQRRCILSAGANGNPAVGSPAALLGLVCNLTSTVTPRKGEERRRQYSIT